MLFSEEAKTLMCGIFAFGHGTVTSHPPHATVTKYRSAFDELLDGGLITVEPFNRHDVWVYKPTPKIGPIANEFRRSYFERAFAPTP